MNKNATQKYKITAYFKSWSSLKCCIVSVIYNQSTVAQMAERVTQYWKVLGSIPTLIQWNCGSEKILSAMLDKGLNVDRGLGISHYFVLTCIIFLHFASAVGVRSIQTLVKIHNNCYLIILFSTNLNNITGVQSTKKRF